jgi:hypothetical protein
MIVLQRDFSGQAVDLDLRDSFVAGFQQADDPDRMTVNRFQVTALDCGVGKLLEH